jgi:hypothetical protein
MIAMTKCAEQTSYRSLLKKHISLPTILIRTYFISLAEQFVAAFQ